MLLLRPKLIAIKRRIIKFMSLRDNLFVLESVVSKGMNVWIPIYSVKVLITCNTIWHKT
jgi:hypothetical protein